MLNWVFRNATSSAVHLGTHIIPPHYFIEVDNEDVSLEMRKQVAALVRDRQIHSFLVDDGRPVHEMNECMILQKYEESMDDDSPKSVDE